MLKKIIPIKFGICCSKIKMKIVQLWRAEEVEQLIYLTQCGMFDTHNPPVHLSK